MHIRFGWLGLFAAFAAFPAFALSPSGTAIAVIQATSASGPGGARTLADTKPVFSGDSILTGAGGRAQILFNDDTRLVVGSNSSVVIDRFVVGEGSAAGAAINFTRGAFRFITGGQAHDSYAVKTPTATITVRGTEFDISIGARGTSVVVFDGEVEVCNRASGKCATVNRSCGAVVATRGGGLELPEGQDRAGLIRASFPLAAGSQAGLRPDFRVNTKMCGLGSSPDRDPSRSADPPDRADPPSKPSKPHKCYTHNNSYSKKGGKGDDSQSARSSKKGKNASKGKSGKGKNARKGGKKGGKGKKGGRGRGRR